MTKLYNAMLASKPFGNRYKYNLAMDLCWEFVK